jgi:hypothetical protein
VVNTCNPSSKGGIAKRIVVWSKADLQLKARETLFEKYLRYIGLRLHCSECANIQTSFTEDGTDV